MLEIVTPALTGDLTLLATVKAELKITGTDEDDFLTDTIHRASAAIAKHCGRTTFGRETYRQTEFLSREVDSIILDQDLDVDVSSVVVDDTLLPSTSWILDGLLVRRLSAGRPSCWSAGSKIVLTYEAGFQLLGTLPYDIEQVCLDLVKDAYRSKDRDRALRSERVLDISEVTFFGSAVNAKSGGLPPDLAARVEDYRLWPTK